MNTSPFSPCPAAARRASGQCRGFLSRTARMRLPRGRRFRTAAAALLGALLAAGWAAAAEPATAPPREPIKIVADRLLTDSGAKRAEFSGNVTASQGATTLAADRLVIFYTGGGTESTPQEGVQRIEAYGNVRIDMEDRVATTDQAVYTTADRKLVLTGPGSKIARGPDAITGNEIIFDRERQTVTVESRGRGQVNAIIHSGQRGLN